MTNGTELLLAAVMRGKTVAPHHCHRAMERFSRKAKASLAMPSPKSRKTASLRWSYPSITVMTP